jgi:hypothetical protein
MSATIQAGAQVTSTRYGSLLVALLLAGLVYLLYAHNLQGFWRGDDTAILLHMLRHPLADIFFSPAAWQELSSANLTPWLSLSLFVDYRLAGLIPTYFYWHQLTTLWLVALVLHHLLALFITRGLALAGACLFLLGMPVLTVSAQLMSRHYLEGLLFCLLSLYLFLRHQRSGNLWQLGGAVLSFALAVTAKEIYVPLGILPVVLAKGGWHARIRQAAPFVATLVLYVIWRSHMLPGVIGGYTDSTAYLRPAFWLDVISDFIGIPAVLFGPRYLLLTLPMFGAIAVALLLQRRRLPLAVLLVGLVFAPLVPLVVYPGLNAPDRYLLLPWTLLCAGFAWAVDIMLSASGTRMSRTLAVSGTSLLLLLCAILLFLPWQSNRRAANAYYAGSDTQMRFLWSQDARVAFVPDRDLAALFWMIRSSREIRRLLDPMASTPKAVIDPVFLDDALPLFEYSPACVCMQDVSATIPERLRRHRDNLRPQAPLTLAISNARGLVSWAFGPYEAGTYNVLFEELGNLPLPREQRNLRTSVTEGIDVMLRYTAPDGWTSYSPRLRLEPDGVAVNWSRE